MEREILDHYAGGVELDRISGETSRIEFERTKELLQRFLPPPPARVLDVGGGPGAYAEWLAGLEYEVRLIDAVPLHVEQATKRARSAFAAVLGDARRLEEAGASRDVVLLLGPLYHLIDRGDRVRALAEAARVVRPGGVVAAAAISRFASVLDGLRLGYLSDPGFRAIVARDLAEGQHRNPDDREGWFTTAFFHHPDELRAEIAEAGLDVEGVFGIEGPGWLVPHLWEDPEGRENVLRAARAVEQEQSLLGLSAHLLAVARRPA